MDSIELSEQSSASVNPQQPPVTVLRTVARIQEKFIEELCRAGLKGWEDKIRLPLVNQEFRIDPYDQSKAFFGEWRHAEGRRIGTLMIHGSGQVFAEFDILLPHPKDSRWFIEAVTAWGDTQALKAELRLLPTLGE